MPQRVHARNSVKLLTPEKVSPARRFLFFSPGNSRAQGIRVKGLLGFPLETGCLAPSARTETEKLSEAKAGYTREGAEGAVWGARASPRQGKGPRIGLGQLTAMRASGYIGTKHGLLHLSYCREKRTLFTARGRQRSLSWALLFPGECGITTLGILILAPVTGSACPGPALTRTGLPHPGLRAPLSEPRRPPQQPQSSSGLAPPPSLLSAPSLPGAHPPSSAPSFLRVLPPPAAPSLLCTLPPARRFRLLASRPCAQACPAPSPPPARAPAPASPRGGLARSQGGPVPGTGTGPSGAAAPVLPRQPGRLADRSCARIYLAPPRSTREGEYAAAGLWGPAAEGGERRDCPGGRGSSLAPRLGEVVGPGTWTPRCTGSMWCGHSPGELGPFSWTRFSREA